MTPSVGTLWHDRYRLQRALGGGAVAVFLAADEVANDPVILKILRPEFADAESAFAAWLTDARVRARLRGPTPRVRDVRFAPLPYSVSDVAVGETLLARLQSGGLLDDGEAVAMTRSFAAIVDALAGVGVGAADMDPTNWLVDPPVYVDCGDVALSVDLDVRSRGGVDTKALRRALGELMFAACTGQDAHGRWRERLQEAGVVLPARPTAVSLRRELVMVSPLLDTLLAGNPIASSEPACALRPLPPVPEEWLAALASGEVRCELKRTADPLAIDSLCKHLGAGVLRVSPKSRVSALGFTHVSLMRPTASDWQRMHALTGTPAFVVVEDLHLADEDTRAAIAHFDRPVTVVHLV